MSEDSASTSRNLNLLAGGEMRARIQSFDWSLTPLGPASAWPQSLRSAVEIMLTSRYPMLVWWGGELIQFYNDAYIPVLGKRHPWGLGQPAATCWAEAWPFVGELARAVITEGASTWSERLEMVMTRNGFPEEVYMTFSYSPILDEAGAIGGLICTCTEETQRTLSDRRLAALAALGEQTASVKTIQRACEVTSNVLTGIPRDLPFTLLYLLDEKQTIARLAGHTGVDIARLDRALQVNLGNDNAPWPFSTVLNNDARPAVIEVPAQLSNTFASPWPEPTRVAMMLPLHRSGRAGLAGLLVVGISPRLVFDENYRTFLDLLARQVATALAAARAYEEERQRAEALAEIDRAKTAFFSNVSHEFRTPLTLTLGTLESVLARPAVSGDDREQLVVGHRNGLRLLRLVNTLLDFSRVEAGRAQASYEPTELAELTADLASSFRSACEAAGLSLVIDAPPLGEVVHVDREMWEKIVLNLVSNAFKFTLAGQIAVTVRREGDMAVVKVRDTGIGIAEHELGRIFERFHRVANHRGRTHEGSGIGLALVRDLVGLNGGSVSVASIAGQGTTFTVKLPFGTGHLPVERIAAARTLASTATRANTFVEEALRWLPETSHEDATDVPAERFEQRSEGESRKRVLVVDDNADMRDYLQQLLQGRYEVATASDGEQALARIERQPPELILADVMMPRLDGFGLLKALRSTSGLREIPVILLSARAGEEAKVDGLEAGADDYLVKPFSARELLARVSANLEMARIRQRLDALRASEQKYLDLFESIDQGFCTIEVVFDAQGRAIDYVFLETNAAFARLTGLKNAVGARMRQLAPEHEQHWFDIYGRIALTGQPERFEQRAQALGFWYNVYAFRTGEPHQHRVGILFDDITERRNSAERLRTSEERLRLALATAGLASWDWNISLDQITWSNELFGMLGYAPNEVKPSYDAWVARIHPDDRAETEAKLAMARDRSLEYAHTFRALHPDGQIAWLSAQGVFFQNGDGTVTRMIGVMEDVTAAHVAELELRQSRERLAAELIDAETLQEISTAIIPERQPEVLYDRLLDAAMALMKADAASMQLLDPQGVTLKLLAWKHFDPRSAAFWANVDVSSASTCGRALVEGKRIVVPNTETCSFMTGAPDLEEYRRSGLHAVQSTPLVGRSGRALGMISTHWREVRDFSDAEFDRFDVLARQAADLIERVQAEAALRESDERFQQFAAASSGALWIRDATTLAMEYVSPAIATVYGIEPKNLLGDVKGWASLIVPDDRDKALQHLTAACEGRSVVHEFRIQRPSDQSFRWIRDIDFPLRDARGRVERIGGIAEDVTEAKSAIEHQAVLLAELQHRVRNIMAIIRAVAIRTSDTARDVPEYSRLMTGRLTALARTQALLTRAVNVGVEISQIVWAELQAQDHTDQFEIAGPALVISPKAAEVLTLAVHELVTNALKYGALSVPEGHISVSWHTERRGEERWLELDWREERPPVSNWRLPTRRGFGTELIEQRVPYELGGTGRMKVTATGVEAVIAFPLKSGESILQTDAPLPTLVFGGSIDMSGLTDLAGKRVLVLEDDYYLATDAARALSNAGAEVIGPFPTETAALAAISTEAMDAAVVDINLGAGASFESAKALRAKAVPFVFLTGYNHSSIPPDFAEVTRLEKPAELKGVVKAVSQLVSAA